MEKLVTLSPPTGDCPWFARMKYTGVAIFILFSLAHHNLVLGQGAANTAVGNGTAASTAATGIARTSTSLFVDTLKSPLIIITYHLYLYSKEKRCRETAESMWWAWSNPRTVEFPLYVPNAELESQKGTISKHSQFNLANAHTCVPLVLSPPTARSLVVSELLKSMRTSRDSAYWV